MDPMHLQISEAERKEMREAFEKVDRKQVRHVERGRMEGRGPFTCELYAWGRRFRLGWVQVGARSCFCASTMSPEPPLLLILPSSTSSHLGVSLPILSHRLPRPISSPPSSRFHR